MPFMLKACFPDISGPLTKARLSFLQEKMLKYGGCWHHDERYFFVEFPADIDALSAVADAVLNVISFDGHTPTPVGETTRMMLSMVFQERENFIVFLETEIFSATVLLALSDLNIHVCSSEGLPERERLLQLMENAIRETWPISYADDF